MADWTTAELFCGAGGFRAGLPDGWETLWATDIDSHSIATYSGNTGDECIQADIRDIDFSALPSPDLLTFGFPCNEFSSGNSLSQKKLPYALLMSGEYGSLWRECVRALDALQPAMFVAENVPALRRGGMSDVIASGFVSAGYQVSAAILNAADYGAPQVRKRLIYGGVRKELEVAWLRPEATRQPASYTTIGESIGDMGGCDGSNNHQIYPPSKQCRKAWKKRWQGKAPRQKKG